jgi:hypothetical protein
MYNLNKILNHLDNTEGFCKYGHVDFERKKERKKKITMKGKRWIFPWCRRTHP